MAEEELKTIFDCQRSGLPYPPKDPAHDIPVLICLAGFPDTAAVWDPLTNHAELQSTHHIITLGLPGLQLDELPSHHKWGYTIGEIQDALHKVVLYCNRQHPCHQATIHLVGHDWGATHGYLYVQSHSERVDKYAALDVGIAVDPKELSWMQNVSMVGYFLLFSVAFVVNNLVSKRLAALMIEYYPWGIIGPLDNASIPLILARPTQAPHVMYPYLQLLKHLGLGRYQGVKFSKIKHVPQCFMYGTSKFVMYHSQRYLNQLSNTRGCSWHEIKGGGHWFYTEPAHSHSVAKRLSEFFLDK